MDRKPHLITQNMRARKPQCVKCLCSATSWEWGNWNWLCLCTCRFQAGHTLGSGKDSSEDRLHQGKGRLPVAREAVGVYIEGIGAMTLCHQSCSFQIFKKGFRKRNNNLNSYIVLKTFKRLQEKPKGWLKFTGKELVYYTQGSEFNHSTKIQLLLLM